MIGWTTLCLVLTSQPGHAAGGQVSELASDEEPGVAEVDWSVVVGLIEGVQEAVESVSRGEFRAARQVWAPETAAEETRLHLALQLDRNMTLASVEQAAAVVRREAETGAELDHRLALRTGPDGRRRLDLRFLDRVALTFVWDDQAGWGLERADDLVLVFPLSRKEAIEQALTNEGLDPTVLRFEEGAEKRGVLPDELRTRVDQALRGESLEGCQNMAGIGLDTWFEPPVEIAREFAGQVKLEPLRRDGQPVAVAVEHGALRPTWEAAQAYCEELEVAGHTGWRVVTECRGGTMDWAKWCESEDYGGAALSYLRWEGGLGRNAQKRWSGFGAEDRSVPKMWGTAAPEDANVPPDKRMVFCELPFPYADELQVLADSRVSAALERCETATSALGFQ